MYRVIEDSTHLKVAWSEERPGDRQKAMEDVWFEKEDMPIYRAIKYAAKQWLRKNSEDIAFRSQIENVTRITRRKTNVAMVPSHLWARICKIAYIYFNMDYRNVSEKYGKNIAKKVHEELLYRKDMIDLTHPYRFIQRW